MPLMKNGSQAAVSQNIRQLRKDDYPQRQAIAIAMDIQRRSRRGMAEGGDYAGGGNIPGQYGFMHGGMPGRADTRPTGVKGGSYVIPADVVSGLGQGNSMAGANTLNRIFKMGSVPNVPMPKAQRTPMPMPRRKFADGGEVDINVSDGEYLIPPEKVAEIGEGDVEYGHSILDKFVQQARAKSIQHLSTLPPPKGSEQSFNGGGDVGWDDQNENSGNPFDTGFAPFDESELPMRADTTLSPYLRSIQGMGVNQQYAPRILGMRRAGVQE